MWARKEECISAEGMWGLERRFRRQHVVLKFNGMFVREIGVGVREMKGATTSNSIMSSGKRKCPDGFESFFGGRRCGKR